MRILLANQLIEELQGNPEARPPFSLTDGILRYKHKLYIGAKGEWRGRIMQEMHDSAIGGHSGILGTYQRTKQICYWPGLKKDVHQHVSSCNICQMHKHEKVKPTGLLQPISTPEGKCLSYTKFFDQLGDHSLVLALIGNVGK
jgi:hypothetical protein